MATDLDPSTFWSEVRRYGVTIVPYTWTQLRGAGRRARPTRWSGHSVRLFLGSGMATGLWRRVLERFGPPRCSSSGSPADSGAILANVRGSKPGSRPAAAGQPGGPGRAATTWSPAGPRSGPDGLVRRARTGEVGLLLARDEPTLAADGGPVLRGVFAPVTPGARRARWSAATTTATTGCSAPRTPSSTRPTGRCCPGR